MHKLILAASLFASCAGCANLTPLTSMKGVKTDGTYWLTYDSTRRGTLMIVRDGNIQRSCSEPAPDTSYSFANSLKGTFKTPGGTSAEGVDAALNATSIALAGRDNLVLLARESLFRLCEARANGDISDQRYADIFQGVLQQVKEIAAAEKARSGAVADVAKALQTK